MMLFQSPLVWLVRFRNRKGYGVHSPFAFKFITEVLYNKSGYYAYSDIDRSLRWWQKGRKRSVHRLLFRLTNFHEPMTLYCSGVDESFLKACMYASRGMEVLPNVIAGKADMLIISGPQQESLGCIADRTMVVVLNIHRHRSFWKTIKHDDRITVTFDLYDIGIAFARKDLNKQHYKVNW